MNQALVQWARRKYKLEVANKMGVELSDDELERYKRQIILPEVGIKGQQKIKAAKVLLVGAGGLGSAVGFYLAAAGIGKIGIVDSDAIDLSNLNRQVLHRNGDIGLAKAESARFALKNLNQDIEVLAYPIRLTLQNAEQIVMDYDMIVDCSDNFPARYLMNQICVLSGKPFFYGAVSGFEGQMMTIIPGLTPCYNCLFPNMPTQSDNHIPVVGVVTGVIGMIQATQVLKYILGHGDLLDGKLFLYNALKLDFLKVDIKRSSLCSVCSGVVTTWCEPAP